MERTVRTFFDRVWTRGEVQLLPELLTDDFVWKVGSGTPASLTACHDIPGPACTGQWQRPPRVHLDLDQNALEKQANKHSTSRPLLALPPPCLALTHPPLTDALQDAIWMPNRPIVGPKAFSTFVQQMRDAYPDLAYEVEQVRCLLRLMGCCSALYFSADARSMN